jgi:predicted O-linked N-acetylglucosamine transferase (SPINDLY family)
MVREDYGKWLERGRKHQEAGRPIDAMVCYRRALKSNQYAVQAQYRLGEVLHALGQNEEALAAWRRGLAMNPDHERLLLSYGGAARRAGAHTEALDAYQRLLSAEPRNRRARVGLALTRTASGDAAACEELALLLSDGTEFGRWDELGRVVSLAPPSIGKASLLRDLAALRGEEMPPLLLACAAQEMVAAGEHDQARNMLARAEALADKIDDPETLRRLALAASPLDGSTTWAERYARLCAERFNPGAPLLWPRRSAGTALRVAYFIGSGTSIEFAATTIAIEPYLRAVIAAHPRDRIAATVYVADDEPLRDAAILDAAGVRMVTIGSAPGPGLARALAETDCDALVDLVGMRAPLGPILAQRVARTQWTYAGLVATNVAPLVSFSLNPPDANDEQTLEQHRLALEAMLQAACTVEPAFAETSLRAAADLSALWREAAAAQGTGKLDAAIDGYRQLLAEQPGYAPAQHLLGVALRERGEPAEAERMFAAAVAAAPGFAEPRVALANLWREDARADAAVKLCREGLALRPKEVSLWRALGLAQLAQRRGRPAREAFKRALALAPTDADTHYNEGVALHMMHRSGAALRAYQRALALRPDLLAADFNIGVIFRERGRSRAAVKAFKQVLERDARHVAAHKALAETLLEAGRIDDWLKVFDRFEAACPDALPLAAVALEACQYRADFARLDRYLERLRRDDFKSTSDTERADSLEELLFLLLYFDFEPEAQFRLYQAYDAAARRVYGAPLALVAKRSPGRIRVGYLSGDLRNHVMGKMMWSAIERHDRERFELFFYSLSAVEDEWTERYRGLSGHFEAIGALSEQEAAARIAQDDIDVLVDLGTNTLGAKPGILALKPARVQLTHVASAGVVGLSTIDFKLTDRFADVAESQRTQLETLLPMEGCVYPYRHVEPAREHPFHRQATGFAPDAVVIGVFVNPLKLSRRCLALWCEILVRVPGAVLAVSPRSPERRAIYARLFSAAGIPHSQVRVVPQGSSEGENRARYGLVDLVLDPMPYGGANGTLEPLDMGVPVVSLVGTRHGERCAYSILANLGVKQTIAATEGEYVEIAVRLATDAGFRAEVRAAIRRGLEHSALTDMDSYARHLEEAYLRALEQRCPEALADARDG